MRGWGGVRGGGGGGWGWGGGGGGGGRTTAIDHRQTMAAFPAICRARATCSALDFASLPGPIQRVLEADAKTFPPSRRQAGTDD